MPITFKCDCGKQLTVRDDLAGKRGKCPACGKILVVPGKLTAAYEAVPQKKRKEGEPRIGVAIAIGAILLGLMCAGVAAMVLQRRTPESRIKRAFQLMEKRKIGEARTLLKEVLEKEPNNIEALRLLAESYWAGGNLQKAMEYIQKALKVAPEDAETLYDLALVSLEAGKKKQAYQAYLRLKKVDEKLAADVLDQIRAYAGVPSE